MKGSILNNPRDLLQDWLLIAILEFLFLSIFFWLLVNDVHLTMDDGYYYFKIAENLAGGLGSTFDGIHLTNGYHPLWLLILVAVSWATSSTQGELILGIGIQVSLSLFNIGLVYIIIRRFNTSWASLFAGVVWIFLTYRVSLGGLEFSLHTFFLLIIVNFYQWKQSHQTIWNRSDAVWLGCLLSLAFLSRLETCLLSIVLASFLALRGKPRRVGWLLFPVFVTSVAYFMLNWRVFGHLMPVSGWIKRSWSEVLLVLDSQQHLNGWVGAKTEQLLWPLKNWQTWYVRPLLLGVYGILFTLLVVGGYWLFSKKRKFIFHKFIPWLPIILYSLMNFLCYAIWYQRGLSYSAWYFPMQALLSAWILATLICKLITRIDRFIMSRNLHLKAPVTQIFIFGGLSVCVSLFSVRDVNQLQLINRPGQRSALYDALDWVKANLPEDSVIGAWNAGTLGYLSERTVINMDGVVNSWQFALEERYDLCDYWRENDVMYLVDAFQNGQALSVLPTIENYKPCVKNLVLLWTDDRKTPWHWQVYKLVGLQ